MSKSIILKILLLLLIPSVLFLPIFFKPGLLVSRNNDLTEFFWPIFYYVKQNIIINHQIPYWNNIFFAGTPLLPDPQNPIWYVPNVIFLFTNIDTGIVISLFLHIVLGTFSAYLISRKVLKFSKLTSFFITWLFIFSTQLFSFLEAGHWGLIVCWSWMPLLLLSSYYLVHKPSWKMVLLFALSASSIYFNHVLTASMIALPILVYWIYKRAYKFPLLGGFATLVIISPALWYQSHWIPTTTRSLLLDNPEVFPIWRGKSEYIKTLFLFNQQTEKAITLGLTPSILALVGFLKLRRRQQVLVFIVVSILTLVILNNVSPLIPILLKIDFYVLMRVTTRVWFLVFFISLYLIGFGLEKLNKKIAVILIAISFIESLLLGNSYLKIPIGLRDNIPDELYNVISEDKTNFRVLCTTRCIPQKEAAIRNIHLVEGYGTLQGKDYYYGMQKALNTSWSGYTLVIPPFDVYLFQEIQPNAMELLNYNTKYVISKNIIKSREFNLIKRFDNYYFYKNTLWR